jgi:His-Xaa-Ser system protein HxsD
MDTRIEAVKNRVLCEIDEKVFPRGVVVSTAYLFLERCYVRLESAPKGRIVVQLKGKRKTAKARLQTLADEFGNELMHQLMRDQVAEKTNGLREILVGRALLSAVPAGEEGSLAESEEEPDYLDDPLGIAVPWEEKYGDEEQ